jgi:hypothetical protein
LRLIVAGNFRAQVEWRAMRIPPGPIPAIMFVSMGGLIAVVHVAWGNLWITNSVGAVCAVLFLWLGWRWRMR